MALKALDQLGVVGEQNIKPRRLGFRDDSAVVWVTVVSLQRRSATDQVLSLRHRQGGENDIKEADVFLLQALVGDPREFTFDSGHHSELWVGVEEDPHRCNALIGKVTRFVGRFVVPHRCDDEVGKQLAVDPYASALCLHRWEWYMSGSWHDTR